MRDTIWVTKEGEMLLISKMETRHIINCINKIRRDNWRLEFLDRFEIELIIRQVRDEN